MKQKEFDELKKGDAIEHSRYGACDVVDYIAMFGPVVVPRTEEGRKKLLSDSGADEPRLLESSPRSIKAKI